jgi:hypothetical protein
MKVISNSVGSFLTGTDIADAAMQLHVALAHRRRVDVIDIPFINGEGSRSRVQLPVGRCVDVVSEDCQPGVDELLDAPTTKSLEARSVALRDGVGVAFTAEDLSTVSWDEDNWVIP